ncbi:MAG: hypothetical protein ABR594_11345 [Pyrinomonadaceae bacterium]
MRTEEVVFDDGDKTVHTFNDAGVILRTIDYDAAGNIRFDIQYDVDSSQLVRAWKVFDREGKIVNRFEVDFDSLGLEIEKRQYGADGTLDRLQRFLYDENHQRIEDQHFDGTLQLRSKRVYTSIDGERIAKYYDVQRNEIRGPAA